MELIDYWHFIRKWFVLIAVGTLLAFLIGFGIMRLDQRHAARSYRGAASVLVHYVMPFGAPYNATLSPHGETVNLQHQVTDPATLHAVANRYHVNLQQVTSITATVAPDVTRIDIQAIGDNASVANTLAYGMATHLAGQQTSSVQQAARTLQHQLAGRVNSARAKWLAAQSHYNQATRQSHGRPNAATIAHLLAALTILQQNYQTLFSQYQQVGLTPVPAATVERGQSQTVAPKSASLAKTVLPATVLGFFLMVAIAALLDYIESRRRPGQRRPLGVPAAGTGTYTSADGERDASAAETRALDPQTALQGSPDGQVAAPYPPQAQAPHDQRS